MYGSKRTANEQRLALERRSKTWGTASIRLDILDFPNHETNTNVEGLVEVLRMDPQHHNPRHRILATIEREQLCLGLSISKISLERLQAPTLEKDGYPQLDFPDGFRLKCLHGLRRARAAMLGPSADGRWVVELLHAGKSLVTSLCSPRSQCQTLDISLDLARELEEEYAAECLPDDGEFYKKKRRYQGTTDERILSWRIDGGLV